MRSQTLYLGLPVANARDDILAELWEVAQDLETPAAARVAALDKIARIEGAYKPIVIESKNRFRSLADFYANMQDDEPDSEAVPSLEQLDGEDQESAE